MTAYFHGTGSFGGQATTASDGTYTIPGLSPADTYDVRFDSVGFGCAGGVNSNYVPQWWNDVSSQSNATAVSVTSGVTTPGINAAMVVGGQISGTVTAASGNADLSGVCVGAYLPGGPGPVVRIAAATDSNGTYTISGLDPADTYDVGFNSGGGCPNGTPANYVPQWWNDVSSQSNATAVSVTSGVTTPGINAAMVVGGQISGTVTAASGGADLSGICVTAYVARHRARSPARQPPAPTAHTRFPALGPHLRREVRQQRVLLRGWGGRQLRDPVVGQRVVTIECNGCLGHVRCDHARDQRGHGRNYTNSPDASCGLHQLGERGVHQFHRNGHGD